eukprot:TRINITY_DN18417_c0_g1_i1.p3 TRINITY_DN18417_c0_g1~~TRINITY_DN18417_c0_g1_i1.p3  ORF type:complete len:118 (+),score=27.80 TRINITY_DN18417_c0_g1_i1:664-1017(+)
MATGDVELKFRMTDGSDIGPNKYSSTETVQALKEAIIEKWPQGKEGCPKSIQDVKLIHAGKVLDNARTLGESRVPVAETGNLITMHVVIRPQIAEPKAAAKEGQEPKKGGCGGCCIL